MNTKDMSWLEYKHNVMNPSARIFRAIKSILGDIKYLCEDGPIELTFDLDTDNPVTVFINVQPVDIKPDVPTICLYRCDDCGEEFTDDMYQNGTSSCDSCQSFTVSI